MDIELQEKGFDHSYKYKKGLCIINSNFSYFHKTIPSVRKSVISELTQYTNPRSQRILCSKVCISSSDYSSSVSLIFHCRVAFENKICCGLEEDYWKKCNRILNDNIRSWSITQVQYQRFRQLLKKENFRVLQKTLSSKIRWK